MSQNQKNTFLFRVKSVLCGQSKLENIRYVFKMTLSINYSKIILKTNKFLFSEIC